MARLFIQVGSVEVFKEVAVVSNLDCPAVLGTDLGAPMKAELIGRMLAQLKEESEDNEQGEAEVAPSLITRTPVVKEQNCGRIECPCY